MHIVIMNDTNNKNHCYGPFHNESEARQFAEYYCPVHWGYQISVLRDPTSCYYGATAFLFEDEKGK